MTSISSSACVFFHEGLNIYKYKRGQGILLCALELELCRVGEAVDIG